MKVLFVIALIAATALCRPEQKVSVTQDTAGNYRLALTVDGITKTEQGNSDGTVSGSYSYLDADGVLQTVEYTAGVDGFRATGTNLPVAPIPVPETEEVINARAAHLAALMAAAN